MKMFKFVLALFVFGFSWIVFGQAVAPAPVAAAVAALPAVPSAGGLWGWVMAHGGPEAAVLLLVGSFNTVVSLLRDQLAKWDGVDLSQPIPDGTKLSLLNKLALYSGKVFDLVTANVQHK